MCTKFVTWKKITQNRYIYIVIDICQEKVKFSLHLCPCYTHQKLALWLFNKPHHRLPTYKQNQRENRTVLHKLLVKWRSADFVSTAVSSEILGMLYKSMSNFSPPLVKTILTRWSVIYQCLRRWTTLVAPYIHLNCCKYIWHLIFKRTFRICQNVGKILSYTVHWKFYVWMSSQHLLSDRVINVLSEFF